MTELYRIFSTHKKENENKKARYENHETFANNFLVRPTDNVNYIMYTHIYIKS